MGKNSVAHVVFTASSRRTSSSLVAFAVHRSPFSANSGFVKARLFNREGKEAVYEIQNSLTTSNFHHVNVKKTTSPPAKLTQEYVDIGLPTHESEQCGALFWSKHFIRRIQTYNNMFALTSMGGKIDNSTNDGEGPYMFRLHGQNMHLMGGLLPEDDESPRFSQLYIYDTDNEVSNRM
ncbi:uncharacterized protein G2W53_033247 [Senna tora]|uniref:Uncharacterized protein n=1 Tax=Senna tora TaxID=362788 RepID=A0A834WAU1_9FABA|nr:uncharacterized protein G2W53_033247 [Senna tora]